MFANETRKHKLYAFKQVSVCFKGCLQKQKKNAQKEILIFDVSFDPIVFFLYKNF